MKFFTIQFPVMVTEHLVASRSIGPTQTAMATFRITMGDDAQPQDAVDKLVEKLSANANLLGDEG